jgi:threonine synthase
MPPPGFPSGTPAGPGLVRGLRCRECGRESEAAPRYVCDHCFGPLEVNYDYERIRQLLTREALAGRAPDLWRYRELLPLDGPPTVGRQSGYTPLVRADRLGAALGLDELWVKNDAVCQPSLSFKDRVVAVALSKAREFGFETVACASTGNLANAVAAHAASVGLAAWVFIPEDLERAKILGTQIYGARVVPIRGGYDDVNRLCSEVADRYRWGFVNVTLRAYYAEGSKTVGYEIQEQLGFRQPAHVVVPMASGSLLTKIARSFNEWLALGLVEPPPAPTVFHGAQPAGCGPIAEAVAAGRDAVRPVKQPRTIARSLAIGNPADGYYAARAIRASGGHAPAVSDAEIVDGMRLLAQTEGIFTETAGGVTIAALRRLAEGGRIGRGDTVVACITGNGLKTLDALGDGDPLPPGIPPRLDAFEQLLDAQH